MLAEQSRKKHFGVMEIFYILIGMVVAWVTLPKLSQPHASNLRILLCINDNSVRKLKNEKQCLSFWGQTG